MDPTVFADPEALWDRSPAELFYVTKFGRIEKLMPPWRNSLDDEQIWQTVYFAWDLRTSDMEAAAGAELYAGSCAACHGENGRGDGAAASAPLPDFSSLDSMTFISQAELSQRWHETHPQIGADWSDEQRRATLDYVRTFSYLPVWAPLPLSGPGEISGTLLQGTLGGPALPMAEVTLKVYQQTDLLTTSATAVDEEGAFLFEQLPVDVGYYFLLETVYQDVRYTSPLLAFNGPDFTDDRVSPNNIDTLLPVFEKTSDPAGVHIARANWIVEHDPGSLLIGQVYTFGNNSGRTFVGAENGAFDTPVTLALLLPADAYNVEIQDGEVGDAYRQEGNTIYDTRPVAPGEGSRQIFLRYRIPFDGDSTVVSFPIAYEAALLNLLVADLPDLEVDVSFAGDVPGATGQDTIQGTLFRRWSAPVSPGEPVLVSLRGLILEGARDPRPSAEIQPGQELAVAAPPLDPRIPLTFGVAVSLALLAALALFVYRQRDGSAPTAQQLALRRAELIAQIARLDDLHALGEMGQEPWQRKRERLWKELHDVAHAQMRMDGTL